MSEQPIRLQIVRGVSGLCVYLNDYRIAGQKPWGGGEVVGEYTLSHKDITTALQLLVEPARAAHPEDAPGGPK